LTSDHFAFLSEKSVLAAPGLRWALPPLTSPGFAPNRPPVATQLAL